METKELTVIRRDSQDLAISPDNVPGGNPTGSYYIWTIGCQMNKSDSERLASNLSQMGFAEAQDPQQADVIVLNSCVVRQSAEDKVTGTLSTMKSVKRENPNKILALMGCMVGPDSKELKQRFPYVDVFMRPQQFNPLLELIHDQTDQELPTNIHSVVPKKPKITSYIPIIHGCDLFCSFCIIPYRRGRQKSRELKDVVREATVMAERGAKELILLGQTVDAYGHDLDTETDLADLLVAINDIPGIERIRFLTSHPTFMSTRIIKAVARLDKVCEQINLPIQSGDNDILASMRRTYTKEQYLAIISEIRSIVPDVAISTDVIVGYCGETEEQFQNTLDLLESVKFDKVHVAPYSTRKGTIADRKLTDTVPTKLKKYRLKQIEDLQKNISANINANLVGETFDVLIDQKTRAQWKGRTRSDKIVFFNDDGADRFGEVLPITITKAGPWSLQGTIATRSKVLD